MKNYKEQKLVLAIVSIVLLAIAFTITISNTNYVNAEETVNPTTVENGYVLTDEAYYRVDNVMEDLDLYYGLHYEHDWSYTCILDESKIVGNACGGEMYGNVDLVVNQEYSQSCHILTIPSSSNVKVVPWSIVKNGSWQLSTILAVAENYESTHPGWKVIAGTNGDFFDINATNAYPRAVSGTMSANGEVLKSVGSGGWPAVSFKNDGSTTPLVKTDNPQSNSYATLYVYDNDGNVIYKVNCDAVNKISENPSSTSLYFAKYTNTETQSHLLNKIDVTNAYIVEHPEKTVAYSTKSFYGKGEISSYGEATLGRDEFAIVTSNPTLDEYLKVGVTIKVQFDYCGDLEGATEVSGIGPTFLTNGQFTDDVLIADYMYYRYPRTLLGYKADGSIVMAVTDGRQANSGYFGLNGVESAAQMLYEGCVEAYSFDGGGSTSMVLLKDGVLTCVNSPSDGSLRQDGNAILVVAQVPEISTEFSVTQDSINVKVDIIKMLDTYKQLYIECDGKKEKVEEGKVIVYDGLKSYTTYAYQFYSLVDGEYVLMPFAGSVTTSKNSFTLNDCEAYLTTDISGNKVYKVNYSVTDPDDTIVNVVLYVNGTRVYDKNGVFTINYDYGSPLTCDTKLVITYELNKIDGRQSYESYEYNLKVNDAVTQIDSIFQEVGCRIDKLLSGK